MRARKAMKRHYFLWVVICLLAVFLGTEFQRPMVYLETDIDTENTDAVNQDLAMALREIFLGDADRGREIAGEMVKREEQKSKNPILGRSRGVLARVINEVNSGSVLVMAAFGIYSIGGSGTMTLALLILCSLVFLFVLWYFLYNMYGVIYRRVMLEGRCYEKIHLQRFLFLIKSGRWRKVSRTMFVAWGLRFLWSLTIVGGIIKRYSYYLVPFITAENPDIEPLEAVTLSRTMMRGHKWECFVLELSYLGWELLGILTLGISSVAFSNPYKIAGFCEYYTELRRLALERSLPGSELLNDPYLFEKASAEVLSNVYNDVLSEPESTGIRQKATGVKGFFREWFGIAFDNDDEKSYEEEEGKLAQSRNLYDAARGFSYPVRLFSIPEARGKGWLENFHYIRSYSAWNLILLFFIFSVAGWLWEVSLHLISDGELVKRGVLHGPWLPIYGSGSVLILTLLNKLRKNPAAEFFATILVCGLVEYGTAYALEMTHGGMRWWDYTGYFLNLHGRICAEGLLVFGVGGAAIVYIAAPFLDSQLKKIKLSFRKLICAFLVLCFLLDQGYSSKHPNMGEGITNPPPEKIEKVLLD